MVAERTTKLVAWVGAGLSVPAGLPTWIELRSILLAACTQKAATLNADGQARISSKLAAAQTTADLWVAFAILKEALGATTYRHAVRTALAQADIAPVPDAYESLWRIGISGCVSLNLDRFVARAFSQRNAGKTVHEFGAHNAGNSVHLVKGPQPWIASLHGLHSDESSWVFTNKDLNTLLRNEGYKSLVNAVFTGGTVLFVGIGAEDIAAGGHLAALTANSVDTGEHFWITDRTDPQTDEWAERAGISVIRYSAPNHNHSALTEFFADLLAYIPKDDIAPPVLPATAPSVANSLPTPTALATENADTIRQVLNAEANRILTPGTPDSYERYKAFCAEYDESIYRAWYVSISPPNNSVLGYKLERQLDRGAFGTVFCARNAAGETVALKLLHEGIRNSQEMLQSFRRGVRSMRILSERRISGMVPYLDASEIPAFVVMQFIPGLNLRQAVEARMLESWDEILEIACNLTRVIRDAHGLPERVLHRDIRPSNIMLETSATGERELVVLDFDLSWHRGAHEASVCQKPGMLGYLAPEQVGLNRNASTRHAAVDSFGTGMTIYFICGAREPEYASQRHATWHDDVATATKSPLGARWRSMDKRIARLIKNCTSDSQMLRWDMTRIYSELERLRTAQHEPSSVVSSELVAEELAAHSLDGYQWSEDRLRASQTLVSGTKVEIQSDEVGGRVILTLLWNRAGTEDRREVGKWLTRACDQAISILTKHGWKKKTFNADTNTATIVCDIFVSSAVADLARTASGIALAIDKLRFD